MRLSMMMTLWLAPKSLEVSSWMLEPGLGTVMRAEEAAAPSWEKMRSEFDEYMASRSKMAQVLPSRTTDHIIDRANSRLAALPSIRNVVVPPTRGSRNGWVSCPPKLIR